MKWTVDSKYRVGGDEEAARGKNEDKELED